MKLYEINNLKIFRTLQNNLYRHLNQIVYYKIKFDLFHFLNKKKNIYKR